MTFARSRIFLVAILLCAFIGGCSRQLTRSDAQKQIEASDTEEIVYVYIPTGDHPNMFTNETVPYVRVRTGEFQRAMHDASAIASAGFLRVNVIASGIAEGGLGGVVDHVTIEPTEKAKPFIAGVYPPNTSTCRNGCIKLISATPVIEITGITDPGDDMAGRKSCNVTYRVDWKSTPIGETLGIGSHPNSVEKSATFVKYDNGWRLEK